MFLRRWLYGDVGCQMYAFTGFLFGSASIGTLTMLAWDRYRLFCNANNSNRYHSIGMIILKLSKMKKKSILEKLMRPNVIPYLKISDRVFAFLLLIDIMTPRKFFDFRRTS